MDPAMTVAVGALSIMGYVTYRAYTHKDKDTKTPYESVYWRDAAPDQKIMAAHWPPGDAMYYEEDSAMFHPHNVQSAALSFWVR